MNKSTNEQAPAVEPTLLNTCLAFDKQEPAHDRVALPQNADQAQAMVLVAENWLKHNAPERLKEPAQAVEQPRAWPTGEIRLVDRADGCRGHYAIGRMHKSGYVEYWNLRANCWSSCSDDVLALEQAQALMYSMSPSVAPAKAVPVAEVVWYDPRLTHPDSKRAPHKIIDASLTFFDEAPVGTKLYTAPPAIDDETRKLVLELLDTCEHGLENMLRHEREKADNIMDALREKLGAE